MKHLLLCGAMAACAFGAAPLVAEEAPSNPTMSDHQMFKDCLERQKTTGITLSKSQMKRVCKDEMKKQKATGAMPTPPTDAPKN